MVNREMCIGCPTITDAKLGRFRNECAKLVLGREYVAPNCENEGPYPQQTIKIEVTTATMPGLLVASETINNQQCGTGQSDALVVTTLWNGHYVGQQVDAGSSTIDPS